MCLLEGKRCNGLHLKTERILIKWTVILRIEGNHSLLNYTIRDLPLPHTHWEMHKELFIQLQHTITLLPHGKIQSNNLSQCQDTTQKAKDMPTNNTGRTLLLLCMELGENFAVFTLLLSKVCMSTVSQTGDQRAVAVDGTQQAAKVMNVIGRQSWIYTGWLID